MTISLEKKFSFLSHHLTMGTGGSSASALHASFTKKTIYWQNHTVFDRRHHRKCWPVVLAVSGFHMCTIQETAFGLFKILFLTFGSLSVIRRRQQGIGPSRMESSHTKMKGFLT